MTRKAVICFTRVPRPGKTKTRLLPLLSGEDCARLHTAFLLDLAAVYAGMDADLFVAYAPDPDPAPLADIFPTASLIFPQTGDDLGDRMDNAIRRVLSLGYDACLLTGSDLPLMGKDHLISGFAALERADIAVGPTGDGGYYLVGMKEPCSRIFHCRDYGTATVLESTLAAAEAAGRRVALAMSCDDVDTPADLRLLCEKLPSGSHTAQFLNQLRNEGIL